MYINSICSNLILVNALIPMKRGGKALDLIHLHLLILGPTQTQFIIFAHKDNFKLA